MLDARPFYERPTRALPPLEAWKDPDEWVWVDNQGDTVLKRHIEKLELPVDDRGFVRKQEAIAGIKNLFHDDYDWPITSARLRPDVHHFYPNAEAYRAFYYDGDTTAERFRDLPANKGKMQRLIHNVWHGVYPETVVPNLEDMADYIRSYFIACSLFRAAEPLVERRSWFHYRREDVRLNPDRLGGREYDDVGEEFLRSDFQKHFERYAQALEDFNYVRDGGFDLLDQVRINKNPRPDHVLKAFGSVIKSECINFTQFISSTDLRAAA